MVPQLTAVSVLLLLSVAECSLIDICSKSKNADRQPLLGALLDLHTGDQCDEPVVPSFQQLAVLEATVKQINQQNRIKLGFQVFDTCSSEQGAVTASMQGFVASQQTCLHSPLFTGFIGPENVRYLRAVKNFTRSFNFSHILAYSVLTYGSTLDKAVYVAKYPVIEFSQAIDAVVEKLGLRSPLIIAEEGLRGHTISNYLSHHRKSASSTSHRPEPCIRRTILTVSSPEQLIKQLHLIGRHDGVVFIVENEWLLSTVSRILDTEGFDDPVIIADLKNSPTHDQHLWTRNVLFINQMSASESEKNKSSMSVEVNNAVHSFTSDYNRICTKHKIPTCDENLLKSMVEDDYDWTLQHYRTSILLLGSAIKKVEEIKCDFTKSKQCLTPDVLSQSEWHDNLRAATYDIESDHVNLHFGMQPPASYVIKALSGHDELEKIGHVVNGEVKLIAAKSLPAIVKNVTCPVFEPNSDEPSSVSTTQDFFEHLLDPENVRLFEAVGMVCGAIIGILFLMLILTTCVYKNFNPESSRPRSPSSHTTLSRAGSTSS